MPSAYCSTSDASQILREDYRKMSVFVCEVNRHQMLAFRILFRILYVVAAQK